MSDIVKEIIKSDGCTQFYTRIDGVDTVDIPEDKLKDISKFLFEKYLEYYGPDNTINMIIDEMEPDDDYYDKEGCDQCGDHVSRKTFKFKEKV